jgi:RHH-type rel operon transcriptional repressor/antitoxin RelB
MNTDTFSVRLDRATKTRLQKLAKSTGRSRAYLAARAIQEYLDINEWQVERTKQAIRSLDAGKSIQHDEVKRWIASWGGANERALPTVG